MQFSVVKFDFIVVFAVMDQIVVVLSLLAELKIGGFDIA